MLQDNLNVNTKGHLTLADVDTVVMAQKYGTPLMLMDENRLRNNIRRYVTSMQQYFGEGSMPLLASKALCFKEIYRIAKEENIGIDLVSGGELYTAISVDFPLKNAFFHGNNKTDADIRYAIDNSVGYFVVDNVEELNYINDYAKEKGVIQNILFRLSPGIDPHTHAKISTGKVDSKFGIAIATGQADEIIGLALGMSNVKLVGLHCHIGSQIFDVAPFCDCADLMIQYIAHIKEKFGYVIDMLNLGGGFAVRYVTSQPNVNYEKIIFEISRHVQNLADKCGIPTPKIIMEPGRSIVADTCITLYTVGSVKEIKGYKNYISIDGGMPDNPRYALYQSEYTCLIANKCNEQADYVATIAGRCCESGDLIQEDVTLPKPQKGDVVAVLVTGAYNYSMASNYNRLPRPPIVMVNPTEKVVVRRETYEDLTKLDV